MVVVFYCFCPFTAITYVLIIIVANVVVGQMFFQSWEVKVIKSFVLDCKKKFVTLGLIDFRLYIFVEVAFSFEEISG